jgi:hypothetical protein
VPIGFGQFQPVMNSKNGKSVGYSGRTDRVCAGGLVGRVGLNASSLIFSHLSRFHLLHCLPTISLKPTNPTLTPPSLSNPQIDKPTNRHTTTNNTNPNQSEKKRERKREWKRESERERKKKQKKKTFKPLGGNPSSFFLAKIPQRMAKRTRKMLRES